MKISGWFLGCGAILALVACLIFFLSVSGSSLFNPGALSSARAQNTIIAGFSSHADFESRCELCHTPFQGPDATRCTECHRDVRDQIANVRGAHGQLRDVQSCAACHPDHKGARANLTRVAFTEIPHNQFGFSLARHERDYDNAPLTCRACHTFAPTRATETLAVRAACVSCHTRADARFVAEHRAAMGEQCLACHDGTDRLRGFDHNQVFALDGKHATVACSKCHIANHFRGTPRECVQCHADPAIHRGQFSNACAACHTAAGWRPARLIRHSFPLDHGGKPAACQVCHPANYGTNTCYTCHAHEPNAIARTHLAANIRDVQACTKCHPTGKKIE
ncbi:MAG: hypothetical protein HZC40_08725 [Chloroflexi bacterium]|nr:hypothetical protein [Chloroflexota bacterium]